MHWTDLLQHRRIPTDARVIEDVPCFKCGYNLRESRAKGVCPECGQPVSESLAALARPDVVASGLELTGKSYLALYCLVLGCLLPISSWPLWIVTGVLTVGTLMRLVGVAELRFRSGLDQLPAIGARLRWMWLLALLELGFAVCSVASLAVVGASGLPFVGGGTASVPLVAAVVAWMSCGFALAFATGWMGSALSALLGLPSAERELLIQQVLIVGGPAIGGFFGLIALIALAVFDSRAASATVGALAAGLLGVIWAVAAGLTFTGLQHLASGAGQQRGPREHLLATDPPAADAKSAGSAQD